jgi:uncharacterized membrane protein YhaH (DUF805 family)
MLESCIMCPKREPPGAGAMPILRLFFDAAGRLAPAPFILAVILVYALGLAAQLLTAPGVTSRAGLWPFALAQALLVWVWFALHAKRLRDAGYGINAAQGVAAIYALAVVLLVFVAAFFLEGGGESSAGAMPGARIVLLHLLGLFQGPPDPLTLLALIACLSVLIAPACSIWAATRPSRGTSAVTG